MSRIVVVALGGAIGAVARYWLSGSLQTFSLQRFGRALPLGTFAVNALGCLLIGALMVLVHDKRMPEAARLLCITGILGAFTTFSAFGYESVELMQEREFRLAGLNVLGNLLVGLGAVWLGQWGASAVLRP